MAATGRTSFICYYEKIYKDNVKARQIETHILNFATLLLRRFPRADLLDDARPLDLFQAEGGVLKYVAVPDLVHVHL